MQKSMLEGCTRTFASFLWLLVFQRRNDFPQSRSIHHPRRPPLPRPYTRKQPKSPSPLKSPRRHRWVHADQQALADHESQAVAALVRGQAPPQGAGEEGLEPEGFGPGAGVDGAEEDLCVCLGVGVRCYERGEGATERDACVYIALYDTNMCIMYAPSWPGRSTCGGARRPGTAARAGGRPALCVVCVWWWAMP
jgi:hypothetical protein